MAVKPEPDQTARTHAVTEGPRPSQARVLSSAPAQILADPTGPDLTAEGLRATALAAFAAMGGAQALAQWGHAHPAQFYALLAKLLAVGEPTATVWAEVSGTPLGPELSVDEWKESALAWQIRSEEGR